MGRNDKSFGADLDNGAQLVNPVPVDVFTPPTNVDSRLALPPEPPQAGESDLGRAVAEGDKLAALDKIARDMTLLATLVTRRRNAKSENAVDQEQTPLSDASDEPAGLAFAPLGIAMQDGDEVQSINSIAQVVEYLTTKWPIRYGDAFEEALQACVDGVKGRVSPGQVRSAFLKAAGAAGIRVIP
ncbi:DUF982 domain-containing protein [Rhizobium sp. LEGMi135b]